MVSKVDWESDASAVSLLTTELNSLADGAFCAKGSEVNNTDGWTHGVLELVLGSPGGVPADPWVDVYLLKAPDGTNYEDGDGTNDPSPNAKVATIRIREEQEAHRIASEVIELPPCKFKAVIGNEIGQAFAATGNTLKVLKAVREVQ
jgi:hypothetical protein